MSIIYPVRKLYKMGQIEPIWNKRSVLPDVVLLDNRFSVWVVTAISSINHSSSSRCHLVTVRLWCTSNLNLKNYWILPLWKDDGQAKRGSEEESRIFDTLPNSSFVKEKFWMFGSLLLHFRHRYRWTVLSRAVPKQTSEKSTLQNLN